MTSRIFKPAFCWIVLASAAACATSEETWLLREDPAFARGFGDGCASATEDGKSFSTKHFRDEYEFEESKAYRSGWRQGYLDCESRDIKRNDGGLVLGDEPGF
ncbi:MAG: hypothetical protein AAFR21_13975 [Pseudomonadota bacterium]